MKKILITITLVFAIIINSVYVLASEGEIEPTLGDYEFFNPYEGGSVWFTTFYKDGYYYMYHYATESYYRSIQGNNWTRTNQPIGPSHTKFVDGKYRGFLYNEDDGYVMWSTRDKINWTQTPMYRVSNDDDELFDNFGGNIKDWSYGNDIYVAIGNIRVDEGDYLPIGTTKDRNNGALPYGLDGPLEGGYLLVSDNMSSWEVIDVGSLGEGYATQIKFENGMFYVYTTKGVYKSGDGKAWSVYNKDTIIDHIIKIENEYWGIKGQDDERQLVKSSNLQNWISVNIGGKIPIDIRYGGGVYIVYALKDYYDIESMVSTDGTSWEVLDYVMPSTYGNGMFLSTYEPGGFDDEIKDYSIKRVMVNNAIEDPLLTGVVTTEKSVDTSGLKLINDTIKAEKELFTDEVIRELQSYPYNNDMELEYDFDSLVKASGTAISKINDFHDIRPYPIESNQTFYTHKNAVYSESYREKGASYVRGILKEKDDEGNIWSSYVEYKFLPDKFDPTNDELYFKLVDTTVLKAMELETANIKTYEPSNWAIDTVNSAREHNLLSDNIQIDYQKNVSRDEFSEVMIKLYVALGGSLPTDKSNPFKDTSKEYILQAYHLGIVNGIEDDLFVPDMYINRQQMATMLYRTLIGLNPNLNNTRTGLTFTDSSSVSTWALDAVEYFQYMDLINGLGDGRFAPLNEATKEEAIALAERIYNAYPRIANGSQSSEDYIVSGYKGTDVINIQSKLAEWISESEISIENMDTSGNGFTDGIFGNQTFSVLSLFQLTHGLLVDGVYGPETKAYLLDDSKWTKPEFTEYRYVSRLIQPVVDVKELIIQEVVEMESKSVSDNYFVNSINAKINLIEERTGYECTNAKILLSKDNDMNPVQERLLPNINVGYLDLLSLQEDIYDDCIAYSNVVESSIITFFSQQLVKKATSNSFYKEQGLTGIIDTEKMYRLIKNDPYLIGLLTEAFTTFGIKESAGDFLDERLENPSALAEVFYNAYAADVIVNELKLMDAYIYNIGLLDSPKYTLVDKKISPDVSVFLQDYYDYSHNHELATSFMDTLDSIYSKTGDVYSYISYGAIGATVVSGGATGVFTVPLAVMSETASNTSTYLSWAAKFGQGVSINVTIDGKLKFVKQLSDMVFPVTQ